VPPCGSFTREEVSVAPCQSAACLLGRFYVQLCVQSVVGPPSVGFGGGPATLGSEPEGRVRSVPQ